MQEPLRGSAGDHPRILNLTHDNLFIGRFSRYMEEVAPGASDYAIFAPSGQLKHAVTGNLVIATSSVDTVRDLVARTIDDYDFLVVHYLMPEWAEMIPEIPSQVRVFWSGFGGDYYGSDASPDDGIMAPLTASLVKSWSPRLRITGRVAHRLAAYWRGAPKRRAVRRVDAFSAPVPTDLAVMQDRYRGFRGEYVQLAYATADESAAGTQVPTGENILVGNSAGPSNNHLDVFEKLGRAKDPGRKVLVPLSYGEPQVYREAVIADGRRRFGDDFEPILDFMPLNEYNSLISSCSYVIMGHRRQQGLGNIISALLGGCTVLLDDSNPVFEFLSQRGAHLVPLGALSSGPIQRHRITEKNAAVNRNIVEGIWGRAAVLDNLRRAFQLT